MASPLHSPPQALTPDNGSFPRKEFHVTPRRNPSSFSLLCFAGSNLLRLYAFPSSVVSVFRRYFGKGIHSEKTDHNNNFTQFELEGKLWTNKSLSTERLVVEMLSIIYQSGFTYLSTIDYGRESDDRLAIAFSRPSLPSELSVPSASSSPKAPSLAPIPDQPKLRVPFALSFPSSIVLRVICPPLHLTPAILQAVRGAWPRGVQSEKKVGENSFEFKLKGYRWFQEDTFATDSLRYILTLLSSLDAHSFTLQASISLTNRSRNKDFWIFTGPPPPDGIDSPAPSILNASHPDLHGQQASGVHSRLATEPITSSSPLPPSYHARAATDNMGRKSPQYLQHSPGGSSGSLPSPGLRKAAPRAQIPVSVHDTDGEILEISGYRADLPSVIPDGTENMTGVGAQPTPDVFYTTSPFGPLSAAPIPLSSSPGAAASQQQSHTSSFESTHGDAPHTPKPVETDREGELLSPGVFKDSGIYRDSTFSSMSDMSAEIPIKWTGVNRESQQISEERRTSEGPKFPGGWEATPIEEKEEPDATARRASFDIHLNQNKEPEQPVHDVRVASPEITRPGNETRKSEAGLIELNTTTPAPPPPIATSDNTKEKQREASSGVGWVLVNIEGRNVDGSVASPVPQVVDGAAPSSVAVETHSDGKNDPSEVSSLVKPPSAPSTPKTKAIVIVDNPGGKKGKQKKDSSRIKRLLSLTRRDSKAIEKSPAQTQRSRMSSLRRGIPEAKRNDDGRRSFH
ncbi:hypothetical protein GGU11DRAFT_558222 [Lentinula aff. detonsa]|nr:hypothetical protein GGU11DRAFT_558222 [Lentinula aff. detonsa]